MNGEMIRVPVSLFHTSKIQAYPVRPSIADAQLCHYLIHRIAISKKAGRGDSILFDTVRQVTGNCEEAEKLHKKAVAIMDYCQKMGYLRQYYTYIRDDSYRRTDGTVVTDTSYFEVKTDNGRLLDEKKRIACGMALDTGRESAIVALGRMDGIVLEHRERPV